MLAAVPIEFHEDVRHLFEASSNTRQSRRQDFDLEIGMITAAQMRAARALLGIDQKTLAERAGVSLPTIQRMEASDGDVRGIVDSLTKVIGAFKAEGVVMIGDHERSEGGGRGVRLAYPVGPSNRTN